MNKTIDLELINSFEKAIDQKQIKKISNILANNSILKASYDANTKNKINYELSIDLIGLPVKNQARSGRCWLFAATNFIREQIVKKLNLIDFELSNAYLAFWDKVERSNFFLEAIIQNIDKENTDWLISHLLSTGIEDGGQWDMVVNLIQKYGVVPYYVMKDNFHAADTKTINYLLNWKLRDFATKLQSQTNKEINYLRSLKAKMILEVYQLLLTFYGPIPHTFDFEYSVNKKQISEYPFNYKEFDKQYFIDKDLTPLKFYEKYVDVKLDQFISIINAPQKTKNFYELYSFKYLNNVIEGKPILHANIEMDLFKLLIINQLTNKLPVWFGSDVSFFRDNNYGVWDDKMFDINTLFNTSFDIEKGEMLTYQIASMNHAMVIMGVNLDLAVLNKTNFNQLKSINDVSKLINDLKINLWKIENSWGEDCGDFGYWYMSNSWFNTFTFQAVVLKSELNKFLKQLNLPLIEKQKINILDPWDPIGTLA